MSDLETVEQCFDLRGRRVLITGASSGLGAHFAALFAGCRAEVILAGRRISVLEERVQHLRSEGCAASCVQVDVNDAASRKALAESIGELDVLVNNAGIVIDRPALQQSEADWDAVIDTNLKAMFFVAKDLFPALKPRMGAIVNVASILALRQAGNVLPYAVSKAGVIQMTKTLALEWARHGIRVNAIAPGYFETELNQELWRTSAGEALIKRIPQRRLGKLEDLDGPMLLLASAASRYMTGTVLVVDGGHLTSSL
ncbi:3-oxoacyl-ACP reductase (plasmid) [Burkholderia sp. THE68]|uniref:SDR family NAD(P)-dependent oxidoreductase n=1 Tax=Burkholderiaceae TaxID=119060 RepID=UPI001318DD54|nr:MULTISPECIES: SDR family oxidoreductase [Burkholderiaceae]BBU33432.1 3-oxoacyl-ACP reductase [Burkholderia sp. THE68]BCQ28657.1 SDR family oxidoreductase [Caballeronia sp. NK8]